MIQNQINVPLVDSHDFAPSSHSAHGVKHISLGGDTTLFVSRLVGATERRVSIFRDGGVPRGVRVKCSREVIAVSQLQTVKIQSSTRSPKSRFTKVVARPHKLKMIESSLCSWTGNGLRWRIAKLGKSDLEKLDSF